MNHFIIANLQIKKFERENYIKVYDEGEIPSMVFLKVVKKDKPMNLEKLGSWVILVLK